LITLNGKFFQKTAFVTACVDNNRFTRGAVGIRSETKFLFIDNDQLGEDIQLKRSPVSDGAVFVKYDRLQIAG
jgi:hypothetical protein